MTFEYNPGWKHHPIVIDGKIYSFDPKLEVPVTKDHSDYGRTLQDIVGKDKITDELYNEYKEKETWEQMRVYRNELLVKSDWTQGADVPDGIKGPWATYRQSLRDITKAASTDKVVWPTAPS